MNKLILISLAALALAACGGGGGASDPAPAQQSTAVPQVAESWNKTSTPVIVPDQAWEFTSDIYSPKGAVFEPSVLFDKASGTYRMWYSGGWMVCSTGTATSNDGIHWVKDANNPIIGRGKHGHDWACRNSVQKVANQVYIYFEGDGTINGHGAVWMTHSDDGVNNLTDPVPLILTGDVDHNIANTWEVMLPDGTMKLFYDALTGAATAQGDTRNWETFSASCDGPAGPCTKDVGPYKGLQVGKGPYGGGWGRYVNGRFDTYYLAGPNDFAGGALPTVLYHACDVSVQPVQLANSGQPLMPLPAGFDQQADPFLVDGADLPDGNTRMWFDEDDNAHGYAQIMMATQQGALAAIRCP